MLVGAASASANSYDVYACYAGQGTYLNPGDSAASWTLSDNNGSAYYLPFDQCGGSTNGLGVISRSGYNAPAGDFGEVYFQAPGGLHIRRVQLWRSLFDYGQGSGGTSQRNFAENQADGKLPGVGDEFDGSVDVPAGTVGSGDTTNNGIVQSNYTSIDLSAALPATYAYVVGCGFANGCRTGGDVPSSPSGFDTVLKIYGAIVTVEDDLTPSLTLANTGLIGGGVQTGTVPLTLTASAVAGIARLEIYAGSSSTPSLADDFTHTSRCEFWEAVPCQNLSSYLYPVDTTKLPNGTYYLTVKAIDPAGNVAAVSSPAPVTVQNASSALAAAGSPPGVGGAIGPQTWRVFLTVAPRHVHQHTRIELSGRVTTTPQPPDGKLVYLQARTVSITRRLGHGRHRRRVRVLGRWITFDVLNAQPGGSFKSTYTFRLGGRHYYQMRAVAPAEGGFGESAGASTPVLVTET